MIKMKWGFIFGCFLLATAAGAQIQIGPSQGCAIPRLDGDKVPFPLKTANTKFDLAEDETYLLNGFLMRREGKMYFKIDFVTQPWLATNHREQFPYFEVEMEHSQGLTIIENELMQMAVVVRRGESMIPQDQEWRDGMRLDVIVPPVPVKVEPPKPESRRDPAGSVSQ